MMLVIKTFYILNYMKLCNIIFVYYNSVYIISDIISLITTERIGMYNTNYFKM